jgi:DNA-binding NarL/FixJ family response regulator
MTEPALLSTDGFGPMPRDAVYRFLVVDDHPLFREALHGAITVARPKSEVYEATDIEAAIDMLSGDRHGFDLALVDLAMPGTSGFDGILRIRKEFPHLPVIVVSALEDARVVREAMSYGIAGFIPKSSKKSELAQAIGDVLNGSVYLPESFAREPREVDPARRDLAQKLATLTPQQLRVLQMLRAGKLNKQIAFELDVGETTVKAHVSEILRKLNVFSRTQAVIEASRIDFDQIMGHGTEKAPDKN